MQNISLYNQENHENNLFKFDFDSLGSYQPAQNVEQNFHPAIQTHHHHQLDCSYFSDNTPTTIKHEPIQQEVTFSSPQLKPRHMQPFQRKRFKTVVTSTFHCASPQSSPGFKSNGEEQDQDDDEDDEDESGNDGDDSSDHGSGRESVGSNNKRGKYKIYTDQEKATILSFMMKHGMQKTLEIFSNETHKITKRKLKSWFEGQNKVKGVKGRKTNDPNRDQALYEWCLKFYNEYERAPTRKEATKKALELSEDPSFQASKGWLDKFSRKYNIEFTPLKISPPKNYKKKMNGFSESDSASSVSNNESFSMEGISPVMQTIQNAQTQQPPQQVRMDTFNFGKPLVSNGFQAEFPSEEGKINSFFNFGGKLNGNEGPNYERKDVLSSLEQFQPLNTTTNYHYGYQPTFQGNYQPNYQGNYQGNFQPNHQMPYEMNAEGMYQVEHAMNNIHNMQPNSDISSFLELGEAYNMKDWQMKYEYPM